MEDEPIPLADELANPPLTWGAAWLPARLASGPDLLQHDDDQA